MGDGIGELAQEPRALGEGSSAKTKGITLGAFQSHGLELVL